MFLGIFFYLISLCAQTVATAYALTIFLRANSYRLACGFLFLGLGLMIGRRISPLLYSLGGGHLDIFDAFLSVPISLFLLFGMFQIKRLLIELEDKNFILDQFTKLDSLTNAISRSETLARAELEIKKSFRSKKTIAFLMLDIDHFKKVNDLYGHPIGDQVLVNLVRHCQTQLREIDVFGRVGGEEFLMVLPEVNMDQAKEIAERIRTSVSSISCANLGNQDIQITLSIGMSFFDPQMTCIEDSHEILKKYYSLCDQAMYRAKQAGRNRVCV